MDNISITQDKKDPKVMHISYTFKPVYSLKFMYINYSLRRQQKDDGSYVE